MNFDPVDLIFNHCAHAWTIRVSETEKDENGLPIVFLECHYCKRRKPLDLGT